MAKKRKSTLRRPRRLDDALHRKTPRYRVSFQRYNPTTRRFDWTGRAGTFACDDVAMVDRIWDTVIKLIADGDWRHGVDAGSVVPALGPGEGR